MLENALKHFLSIIRSICLYVIKQMTSWSFFKNQYETVNRFISRNKRGNTVLSQVFKNMDFIKKHMKPVFSFFDFLFLNDFEGNILMWNDVKSIINFGKSSRSKKFSNSIMFLEARKNARFGQSEIKFHERFFVVGGNGQSRLWVG